ncbi:unnamed protein product [Moneuplotes crassus]|uniref:Cytochrome P450 n=1 Tax=Euplotes crassus TaxID=5936 RepID=A0AAD1UAF1_EUPCR|nr:unnamed protein product [Moneuplotes crassus]
MALIIAFVIFLVYIFVVRPYYLRWKYSRYSNIMLGKKFIPVLGNFKQAIDCIRAGKVHYTWYKEEAEEVKNFDMKLNFEGCHPILYMVSKTACEEFVKHGRVDIDRSTVRLGFAEMLHGSIVNKCTTKNIFQRRKNMTQLLGLNSASRYIKKFPLIPKILSCTRNLLDSMPEQKPIDLLQEMTELVFNIFNEVLFGKDITELVTKLYPYENSDGTTEEVTLREILIRLSRCYIVQHLSPLTSIMLYFGADTLYYLNPYKRDKKNLDTFKGAIRSIVSTSKETNSIGNKLYGFSDTTEEEKICDLLVIMVGGSETSSHSLVSCLYFLKKHPETLVKLRKELEKEGLVKDSDLSTWKREKLQDCTYLSCFIKEVMRVDPTVIETFIYVTNKETKICNVPIPKGFQIRLDMMTSNYDSDKWLYPEKFIPERHDFDSEFYQKSKQAGKVQDVYTRRPFGHGIRNCPGQTYAILEIKVILAYLVTHIDFEFELEDMNNEGIGFGLGTQFNPKIHISKK